MTSLCGIVTKNMDRMTTYANGIELRRETSKLPNSKFQIPKLQVIKSKYPLNFKDIVCILA